MKTETINFDTANGATTAFVAIPDEVNDDTKAVILIQEWWGLNDNIKNIAERYAGEGYIGIAPDLYRGKLAANPEEAGKLMSNLGIEEGVDIIKNTIKTASEKYGKTQFGISGYCMGGTFSLRSACELDGISAAAPYYGDIPPEDVLKHLDVPTIFISGTKDAWINPEKVSELMSIAEKYDLPVKSVSYEADHAFANETRPEVYEKKAAEDAWGKVMNLFNENL